MGRIGKGALCDVPRYLPFASGIPSVCYTV